MKKLLAVILLSFIGYGYCADDDITQYSPISISTQGTKVGSTLISFNPIISGAKTRTCVTDISVSADNFHPAGFTFTILDGSATAYQLTQSTMAIIESWYPKNPLCLSNGTTTYFSMSSGNFKLNATGYEKSR